MPKWFVIVDKKTGELCNKEGSGIYHVSNDSDMDLYQVIEDCIIVELTQNEYDKMQYCGFELERDGETIFIESIEELNDGEMPKRTKQKNKIDTTKSKTKIKDRTKQVTVNLFGVHYIKNEITEIVKEI